MNSNENCQIVLCKNYSGSCEHTPLTNEDILRLTNQQGTIIYGPTLFTLKYRVLPCSITQNTISNQDDYGDVYTYNLIGQFSNLNRGRRWARKTRQGGMYHATSVLNYLVKEYNLDKNTFISDSSYDTHEKHVLINKIYIDLNHYLAVEFYGGSVSPLNVDNPNDLKPDNGENTFYCFSHIQGYHVPQSSDRVQTLLEELSKYKLYPVTEATLQMVCHDTQRGFYTSSIRMKKPHITDLKLHYGDDFVHIHNELIEMLQEKDSTGITFLHGSPGTGKTFYLRYLINEIKDKSLIYVPPDLVTDMTKPGFLPFLMRHPNSILIVEDAENIIRDRQNDNFLPNQAVSNLLNLSDGLLGDAMHQQIICTFNCDVKGIDPALLRDGRLIVEHKFDKLSIEHARQLAIQLGIPGNGEDIHQSITLAEIYAKKNATLQPSNDQRTENNQKRKSRKINQLNENILGFYS